jgi:hypothetical protein
MINSQDLAIAFLLSSCALFATTIGFAIAWVRARERALRAESRTGSSYDATVANPDRFERTERLERAVDAIALEVERISEGQRFVTRLLAEGAHQTRQTTRVDPPRVITPH